MVTIGIENGDSLLENYGTEFSFRGDCGVIRNQENNVVGFYIIEVNNEEILLDRFEILEKYQRKGYGTEFIKALFKTYPNACKVRGLATEDAVSFYARIGAYFRNSCTECAYAECPYNNNYEGNKNDYMSKDTCDDYSENHFVIFRERI